ncbi:MAG: right-handed parallel beta-helix repeat-containing protein [Micromonosporaceae bacterium]|nr:right-handed parallel beta-helix repeat-containing protein [Micromonosporaceae bacterium]
MTGNTFRNNSTFGIEIGPWQEITEISGNKFINNGCAGIYSYGTNKKPDRPVTISHNTFWHNGWSDQTSTDRNGHPIADGIHIIRSDFPDSIPVVVNGNVTRRSAAYGIYSEPGTAVNTESPNRSIGDRLGCSGIACV